MSTSSQTDRIFLYTKVLNELSNNNIVRVWATSTNDPRFQQLWQDKPAQVEEFPELRPFKEFPYNYLRRLNEFVWDYRQQPPSRLSMARHFRNKQQKPSIRALKVPARALALMKAERSLEDRLERILLSYPRSDAALKRLQTKQPAVILITGPFQFRQPAVVAVAKKLGIPLMALIPSWDNLSTKGRLVFKYDGYLVWSEQTKRELHRFYPETTQVPVYVVGAPQFDVFFDDQFYQSREAFCETQGLRLSSPIIVYSLGSPNFLREHHGALYLAERVARGDFGDTQLIVRPHPAKDNSDIREQFRCFSPRVIVQGQAGDIGTPYSLSQDREQIIEWVNTFRHADVVVNLSSTVTVDAAIFDHPVVNLNYDSEPGQPNQQLVRDINHLWTHFKPIAESGGVWLVNNPEEMVEAVRTYLLHPELHRKKRRWIAEYVCGHLDGRCGERMAQAILDFVDKHTPTQSRNGN
ncbi:MAG: hypothetical protein ND895_26600 [Pyrinomonadaceae bacterium]|nr:hypothetical protein [Pyrinomonadaceae bacterium]